MLVPMDQSYLMTIGLYTIQEQAASLRWSAASQMGAPPAAVVQPAAQGRLSDSDHICGTAWAGSYNDGAANEIQSGQRLLFLDVDGVLHPLRTRLLQGSQKVDTSHCFRPACMQQLACLVQATGAKLVLSSSWRAFEQAREMLAIALAEYGLAFTECTTTAGGESPHARVDQILAFVAGAANISAWAAVDDEDLAPDSMAGSESMMRAVFRQHFVRTDAASGLDAKKADMLKQILLNEGEAEEIAESDAAIEEACPMMALAQRCNFESVGWRPVGGIEGVSSRVVQHLWSGLGHVLELSVSSASETQVVIIKVIGALRASAEHEERRAHASYRAEACFYEQGHAQALCAQGARCPLPLLLDAAGDGSLRICMTRLPGWSCAGGANAAQLGLALVWLARLHSTYWGRARAREAVASGLQPQGCHWHLDGCRADLARVPLEGLEGRLRLAAAALDARLKADPMQTICHGDPKDANMICSEEGSVAFCDFQWVGMAPASKDVAYCLACGADRLSTMEEESYLRDYHSELAKRLSDQGFVPPGLEQLKVSYALAMCDLARWMAGWGWWGHVRVVKGHAVDVLNRLDGGQPLRSESAYHDRVFSVFPL